MRFLITGKNKFPMPPEMTPVIVDATIVWVKSTLVTASLSNCGEWLEWQQGEELPI